MQPVHAHGTHIAGIALGRGKDMPGVAPEAELIAINVFNEGGRGARNSNILGALDGLLKLAWTGRAKITSINISLGEPPHHARPCRHPIWELATRLFERRGVAPVAAAGTNTTCAASPTRPASSSSASARSPSDRGWRIFPTEHRFSTR